MAFLLSTIAEYGEDGWQDYWSRLMDNGAKLTGGWNDAYFVDFTGGAEKGTRPIVVSYDTSPAFTIDKKTGTSTTEALLDTCFRQVEYAGVLANAKNPEGAQEVVDFLLSDEVQAALPGQHVRLPGQRRRRRCPRTGRVRHPPGVAVRRRPGHHRREAQGLADRVDRRHQPLSRRSSPG